MQITIDTKHDSHEDIKKVIRLLSHLINEPDIKINQPNIFEDKKEPTAAFLNMFGDAPEIKSNQKKEEENTESDDIPQVVEYH